MSGKTIPKILFLFISIILTFSALNVNITTNVIAAPPSLPDKDQWESKVKIADGDWGFISEIQDNEYRFYSKLSESNSITPYSSSNTYPATISSSTDTLTWYSKIDLGSYDIRDLIWDGEKFLGLRINTNYRAQSIYLYLNGSMEFGPEAVASSRHPYGGSALLKSNTGEIYSYYYYNQNIYVFQLNTLNFFGSEITAITDLDNLAGSIQIYDFMQDSNDEYHFAYRDSSDNVKIKSSSNPLDWGGAIVNQVAFNYNPIKITEIDGNIVIFMCKSATSGVDGLNHYEVFYTYSSDLITWSSPTLFSSDNGEDKTHPQLYFFNDGSINLQYSNTANDEIFIVRSEKLITAEVSVTENIISLGETVSLQGDGSFTNGSKLVGTSVTWDIYFDNLTLWHTWVTTSNAQGVTVYEFDMPVNYPGGIYKVVMTYEVDGFGQAIDWLTFNYLYRDNSIPITITNATVVIVDGDANFTLSGRYDADPTLYSFTLSLLNPNNEPLLSIISEKVIQNWFSVTFYGGLGLFGIDIDGQYKGQIIIRLPLGESNRQLIDYVEFVFSIG